MEDRLKDDIVRFSGYVGRLDSYIKSEKKNRDGLKAKLVTISESKERHLKSLVVIDKTIQIISSRGIGKIQSIVSGGLKLVFGKQVGFQIEKKEGAKGSSYRFLIKYGDVVGSPTDTFGGGIVNVTSFLLRIIMIKRFKLAKFLAVDESFNNVSKEYLPKVSELLQSLSRDHGFNILAITHQNELASSADRVYQVESGMNGPEIKTIDPSLLN